MLTSSELTPAPSTTRPKVLVIDDEYGPRESVSFLLQDEFEVHSADRVDNGIELLQKEVFAVVIMDIRMPQKNGIQGLEEVRKIDPDVAVIMLTGYGALASAQVAMSLGANEYLKKPFDVEVMLQAVRRHAREALERKKRSALLQQLEEVYAAVKREQRKNQAQLGYGQAATEMVHDLCNPLVVAIGYTKLLLDSARTLRDRGAADLDRIITYAETLEKCSSFCLHLAESWRRSSRNNVNFAPVDLRAAAIEVKSVLFFDSPRLSVSGPSGVKIAGIRYEIIRLLQNLVKNALESGATSVTVGIAQTGGKAVLTIVDNGKGLSPEMTELMLKKPVETTKENGTGLGVTICRHIAIAHHGELKVSSVQGRGTTFTIEFPLPAL